VGKPIDPDKLKAAIDAVTASVPVPPAAQGVAAAPPESPVRPALPAALPSGDHDTGFTLAGDEDAGAGDAAGGDAKVFDTGMLGTLKENLGQPQLQELLDSVIVKTWEIITTMQKAVLAENIPELSARAHELKGMAGNFGLVEISAMAAQIERMAKTKRMEGIEDIVNALTSACVRAEKALKSWMIV